MQYLTLGLGSLEEGLIYAIMAVGIFVSFRILDIPDLTVDGSFITGSAVSIMVTQAGLPVLGIFAAMAAGRARGLYNGAFTYKAQGAADSGGHPHHDGALLHQPDDFRR